MIKSSTTREQAASPSGQRQAPANRGALVPVPTVHRGTKPSCNPKTAGQELGAYLRTHPRVDDLADRLGVMLQLGVSTLDLSGQDLAAEAVTLLCQAFETRPELLRGFVGFHFAEARFDTLRPLLDVLRSERCGACESLDLSGTCVLTTNAYGVARYAPLEGADLRRVVATVKRHAHTLRELKLNQQTGLSPQEDARQLDGRIDPTSPMFVLVNALGPSAVKTLELRDCGLWTADVYCLTPGASFELDGTRRGLACHTIDLRGNEGMFAHIDSPALQARLIARLASHPELKALYLPSNALALLEREDGMDTLTWELAKSAARHLVTLEPFSCASAERCGALKRLLQGVPLPLPASETDPPREAETPPALVVLDEPLPLTGVEAKPQSKVDNEDFFNALVLASMDWVPSEPCEPYDAAMAGLAMGEALEQEGDAAIAECLNHFSYMRRRGIKVLDFSCMTLSQGALVCLATVLRRLPLLLAACVDELNFSGAKLGGLGALLAVLKEQKGGAIRCLDLSGTRLLNPAPDLGGPADMEMPEALLTEILHLAQRCPTLQVLKLNRQPALSDLLLKRRGVGQCVGIDRLLGLAHFLASSALRTLEIRACVRKPAGPALVSSAQPVPLKRTKGSVFYAWNDRLRLIDLRGNEQAFMGGADEARLTLQQFVKELKYFKALRTVYLPRNAPTAFESHESDAFDLMLAIAQSGHAERLLVVGVSKKPVPLYRCLLEQLSDFFADKRPQTEDRRHYMAERFGHQVGHCLNTGDVQGARRGLWLMQEMGLKRFSFRGFCLHANGIAALSVLFEEQAMRFTEFDFSLIEVEALLAPLLEALKVHLAMGGSIRLLDLSGAQTWTRGTADAVTLSPLPTDDLIAVAEFVKACPSLRVLRLNHQTGLSPDPRAGQHLIHTLSAEKWPMLALAQALRGSSVQRLQLRDCDLQLADLELINTHCLNRPSDRPWRSMDLSHNDGLFEGANATRAVIALLRGCAPGLRALHLPIAALQLFDTDKASHKLLMAVYKLRPASQLVTLEPMSSSRLERYALLNKVLEKNRLVPKN